MPLRIPARALAADSAWSELLAAGTREALGRLLAERPRPELFARRALGARWLVFIDGLDEIAEPETRAQVISAIAHQIRRNTEHQLVIVRDATHVFPEPGALEAVADLARAWFTDHLVQARGGGPTTSRGTSPS